MGADPTFDAVAAAWAVAPLFAIGANEETAKTAFSTNDANMRRSPHPDPSCQNRADAASTVVWSR